jgi:phosphoribosylformylglycinamidine cyclo-ligase
MGTNMDKQTYAAAGVDVARAERFVNRLKSISKRKGHKELWPAAGGYAAVYPVSDENAIAVSIDGVGTKLLISQQLKKYDTIGIDLVAMCANDLICVGARPTLFLDYYATGDLNDDVADSVIAGIVKGCDDAGMLLVGGETAEMPGVYTGSHYDLAGFGIGQLSKQELLTGDSIEPGQVVVGIASSGIHSNGLSLARKVLPQDEATLLLLLEPTVIYAKLTNELLSSMPGSITGIAHITGGGWRNIFRLNDRVGYHIENPLPQPDIFSMLRKHVDEQEMYSTFNMGMGLAVISKSDHATAIAETANALGFRAQIVGEVTPNAEVLTIEGTSVKLKG